MSEAKSPALTLLSRSRRCPVCGWNRTSASFTGSTGMARYECGAVFECFGAEIVSTAICPSPTRVAVNHLNIQAARSAAR